jgi:hypothetical protein
MFPNYLMLDHGGVLDGEYSESAPGPNDLLITRHAAGGYQILKGGVRIVEILNQLVNDYDFRILFHSKNSEADQITLLNQLLVACHGKGIQFPQVTAMAVRDAKKYPNVYPANPTIEKNVEYNIQIAGYSHEHDGKSCVRAALSHLLDISDRTKVFVLDDGEPVIKAAKAEKYQTKLIGGEGNTLLEALTSILKVNQLNAVYDPRASAVFGVLNRGQEREPLIEEDNKDCCRCCVMM